MIENTWTPTAWDALAEVAKKQLLVCSLMIFSSKLLRLKQSPVTLLAAQLKAELCFLRGNSCDLKALLWKTPHSLSLLLPSSHVFPSVRQQPWRSTAIFMKPSTDPHHFQNRGLGGNIFLTKHNHRHNICICSNFLYFLL